MSFTIKCWVPRCTTSKDKLSLNFFPLPKDPKFKETWIALTAKKLTVAEDQVYFCERHFRSSNTETEEGRVVRLSLNALPFYGMPEMVCRTCRATIPKTAFFCVVSAIIPSAVPPELETPMDACRPEPLYQILSFCIPNLNLEQNPPSLVCLDCYYHIWQYFLFKLKCNLTETRVRGTLSPEQYGKLVLCRSCPETSSTKFFALHETQPIGLMFKNMFITNYPSHLVPLKLCLKCYNVLNKLMLFHKQCVLADQMIKRCVELNNSETLTNTSPPQIVPPIINEFKSTHTGNITKTCPESIPSTSGYSSSSNNASQFSKVNKPAIEHAAPSLWNSKVDPEMPTLTVEAEVESNPGSSKTFENSNTENESKFSQESYRILVSLMLKNQHLVKPDLDPIEQAKMDLEMWINVVREFHNFGYSYNLECIQSMWSEMKKNARDAQRNMGPITYLDFLVISYLRSVEGDDHFVSENANSSNFKPIENIQTASVASKRAKKEKTVNLRQIRSQKYKTESVNHHNTKDSDKSIGTDDWDVICIDDDDDMDGIIPSDTTSSDALVSHNNDVSSKQNQSTAITEYVQSGSSSYIPHEPVKRPVGRPAKPKDDSGPPKPQDDSLKRSVGRPAKPKDDSGPPKLQDDSRKRPIGRPAKPKDDSGPPKLQDDSRKRPIGRPAKPKDDSGLPKPRNDSQPSKRRDDMSLHSMSTNKTKKWRVTTRPKTKWNVFQKLQLVRAMHKELNRLIEAEELSSLKFAPWKKILQKLAADGFMNTDFIKLYTVWGAMKRSATIYEKNGEDVVDNEVWDLLQLYSEVQKSVTNKNPSGKTSSSGRSSTSIVSNEDGTEGTREESDPPPPKLQKPNTLSAVNSQNSESHVSRQDLQKYEVTTRKQTERMPTREKETDSSNRKKSRMRLPVEDKMEILNLLEQEFKRILRKGPIDRSISDVLRSIKYKNYTAYTMNYTWFNLSRTSHSVDHTELTPLQKKFLKVLKIYRNGKIPKKVNVFGEEKKLKSHTNGQTEKTTDTAENGGKEKNDKTTDVAEKDKKDREETNLRNSTNGEMEKSTDASEKGKKEGEEKSKEDGIKRGYLLKKLSDKDKLQLIAIIRSFGNEVFKRKDRPSGNAFWNKVASKFTGRRGKLLLSQEWGNMLASAKTTWAQGDRTPRVGDKEIIDFMTEVIKEKEKTKEETSIEDGKSIEENAQNDGENAQNDGENAHNDDENAQNNGDNAQNEGENVEKDDENAEDNGENAQNDIENVENDGGSAENDGENVDNNDEKVENDGENAENDSENVKNDDENAENDSENAQNNGENVENDDDNAQNNGEDSSTDDELVSSEIFKNCKEVLKNFEPVTIKEEVCAISTQIKVEQGIQSGSSTGSYDYVSLDDINKHYGDRVLERPQPVVISEVIEIPDSDEE